MNNLKRMKVLHVLSSGNYSGAEKLALQIISETSDFCDAIYFAENGIINSQILSSNIKFHLVDKVNLKSLRDVIKSEKPDIIHAHDFRASLYSSFFSKKAKLICHIHQNPDWFFRINALTVVFFYTCVFADKVIYVGDWYKKNKLFNFSFSKKNKLAPVYLDEEEIKRKSKEHDSDSDKAFDLIFVGRLSKEKDPLRFIRIFREMHRSNSNLLGCIVGDGNLFEECNQSIIEFGLENNISLVGFKSNPYPYIMKSKVVVVPSKYEGFGLVAVEALILEKRVVASRVGGLISNLSEMRHSLCESDDDFIRNINYHLSNTDNIVDNPIFNKKFSREEFEIFFRNLYLNK